MADQVANKGALFGALAFARRILQCMPNINVLHAVLFNAHLNSALYRAFIHIPYINKYQQAVSMVLRSS